MEFRCDNCGDVGPADTVRPESGGVVLVCASCGHQNLLDVAGDPDDPAAQRADSSGPVSSDPSPTTSGGNPAAGGQPDSADVDGRSPSDQARMGLREDAFEAVIPEAGSGPRCPKCAHLLDAQTQHCPRCGLDIARARAYNTGEAPWETYDRDQQASYEQAQLLWDAFREHPAPEGLAKFADFVRDENLLDFGIRQLRFYVIDHRDDPMAVDQLRELAEGLQSRLIVAQARAQASADEFQQDVTRVKNKAIYAALALWVGVFVLFLTFFWDDCSQSLFH